MEKIPTIMLVVAGALHAETGLWLMHRRPEGKHHAGLWEFPGGKVESGEVPENALIRELEEELGIVIRSENLSPAGFANSAGEGDSRAIVILLYTCARWVGEIGPQEGGEVGWFTFEEMIALPKPPLDCALLDQLMQKHRA